MTGTQRTIALHRATVAIATLAFAGCAAGNFQPGSQYRPVTDKILGHRVAPDRAPVIQNFATKNADLKSPFFLSFNRHGKLWFTSSSPHLGFRRSTGKFGVRNLPIKRSPAGPEKADQMAMGPDGQVWFTDYYDGTLGRVNKKGYIKQYRIFQGGYSSGLVTGPDGHLWVLLTGDYTSLNKIDTARKTPQVLHSYPLNGAYQEVITVGSDGNFWVGGSNRYQVMSRVTPDGVITDFPVQALDGIWGVALGPDGNIWFTGATNNAYNSYVSKITPQGIVSEYRIKSQGDGIVAGPDGNMWFTEPYEGLIGKVTMSGVVSEYPIPGAIKHSSPNDQVVGIVAGPDGNLWVAEPFFNAIGEAVLATPHP